MASFVVMRPPGDEGDDRAQFVRDGFSFVAFVVPFVWLAWHRLWLEAALAFAASILVSTLGQTTSWGLALSPAVTLLGLYVALDGAALRIAALRRRGWTEAGVVEAANRDEAEIRWFAEHAVSRPAPAERQPLPAALPGLQARSSGPALGLLSYPGKS